MRYGADVLFPHFISETAPPSCSKTLFVDLQMRSKRPAEENLDTYNKRTSLHFSFFPIHFFWIHPGNAKMIALVTGNHFRRSAFSFEFASEISHPALEQSCADALHPSLVWDIDPLLGPGKVTVRQHTKKETLTSPENLKTKRNTLETRGV